jgi:hypothetical protein
MPSWLGQLVISKSATTGKPPFKVQYWRTPSTTPAFISFDTEEDLLRYLKHCRIFGSTPDQVITQLTTIAQVTLSTFESEEAVS